AMLDAAGYRTGLYTSPHLVDYNERVVIAGNPASDAELCDAFARVEAARAGKSLTYFEYGTLAAIDIFASHAIDAAILEVGLGGRLDAVNAIDADIAVVTSIAMDHQEWLGEDLSSIAREKAGVFRRGRPAVCGQADPPPSLVDYARECDAELFIAGDDFYHEAQDQTWSWHGFGRRFCDLPKPRLRGDFQLQNASTAIAAIVAAENIMPVPHTAISAGLITASLPGRLQQLSGDVPIVLDVAHNPAAAKALAEELGKERVATRAVFAAYRDKDIEGIASAIAPLVCEWHLAGLQGKRGQTAMELAARLSTVVAEEQLHSHESVEAAYSTALARTNVGGRIVVLGSFETVGQVAKLGLYSREQMGLTAN
ncbi:MAG: bifunctional folylpolyglutamate synthase/dihydrofolate synthase, partial [Gammaproteobacteria bacterium]|nr:bifunctional folylpolyglutamate synthase/dihydrofolate synthase [Gammaproteobacteria bacterium]